MEFFDSHKHSTRALNALLATDTSVVQGVSTYRTFKNIKAYIKRIGKPNNKSQGIISGFANYFRSLQNEKYKVKSCDFEIKKLSK